MKNWNIRQRLLFLAIAPLFVTIVVMSFIHTISRVQQFDDEFDRKGNALSKQLALTSEYAVLTGNYDVLLQPVNALLQENSVVHVMLADTEENILISKEHEHASEREDHHTHVTKYTTAITSTLIDINDGFEDGTGSLHKDTQVIGYANVYLSRAPTVKFQRRVLVESFIITILALSITTYIALLMARKLSAPLKTVSTAVSHIRNGNFNHRIKHASGGELGQLEEGINTLAKALDEANKKDRQKTQNLENINKHLQVEIENRKRIEAELIDAKEHAEAANLAKSEFLANMGHELRTPLNSIIGFNELLLMDELSDEHRNYIQHSFNSSKNLLKIIQDILDFSRLDAGRMSIVSVAFNLRQALHEAVDMLSIRAGKKGIELIIDFPPEMPEHVMGDPGRIRQIIVNLMTNAINFTTDGDIVLQATTVHKDNDSLDVTISVKDSGEGIPADKLDTIFDRFTQADGSTTRQQQGLGLGLAICKQLAELMGGDIRVDSEAGNGSIFTLSLNLPVSQVSEKLLKDPLSPMSILLADKNTTTRDILARLLRFSGMNVDVCSSFAEVCAIASDRSSTYDYFNIIMLDNNLSNDLAADIRKEKLHNDCLNNSQIVLLANAASIHDLNEHLGTVYTSLMSKPVNPHELNSMLKKLARNCLGSHTDASVINATTAKQPRMPVTSKPESDVHILVVDDNDINIKLAVSVLHKMGYIASKANSGQEALQMLKENTYSAILMDVLMPEMDGYETTRQIRQYEKQHNLGANVIIALTAKAMNGDREQCLASGMNDYISKPLHIKTLKGVLQRWLEK